MNTVSSAIAPFAKIARNLRKVVSAQDKAKTQAENEAESARETFLRITDATAARRARAEAEKAKAEKILAKLDALLADDEA